MPASSIASVDTYLRFAEATNRLDLWPEGGKGLPEIVEDAPGPGDREGRLQGGGEEGREGRGEAKEKVEQVAEKAHDAAEKVTEAVKPG